MDPMRDHLRRLLDWHEAHADLDAAVADMPQPLRGKTPEGASHSPWELLEHIRITQHDILDFCVNANYKEIAWPDNYWPKSAAPPGAAAWDESIAALVRDREALKALVADATIDLFAKI